MPRAAGAKSVVAKRVVKKSPAKKVKRPELGVKGALRSKAVGPTPQIRFSPPVELHKRFLALLLQVESASDATMHRAKLSAFASELTAAGLDFYFLRTLRDAKVGFVTQQSAALGLIGVKQVMGPVIRNIVGRLDHSQLQAIARSIRQLMD